MGHLGVVDEIGQPVTGETEARWQLSLGEGNVVESPQLPIVATSVDAPHQRLVLRDPLDLVLEVP